MGLTPGPIPNTKSANSSLPTVARADAVPKVPEKSAAGFVQQHTEAAKAAEAATGIPAAFMIAQSAHETGWGKKEIIGRDGSNSNNLFGIKAGANWKGPTVDVMTTEYIGGRPQKVVQKFRAYASHAESFADYAKLMKDSPRYQNVVAAGSDAKGFAQGLQKAGYATDPAYAQKLARVIDTTLRLQRQA
jgi:flagellar protein FlgJ